MWLWLSACVVPVPEVPSEACTETLDADADQWHAAEFGGLDCDDADPKAGGCLPEANDDTAPEPCVPSGADVCNGVDDDCDGEVDDPYLVRTVGAAKVVAAGALLEGGAAALVVGRSSDAPGEDGMVDLYDAEGTWVIRVDGADQSPSFGAQVAVGDLTGDGVADLVVAAPFASTDDGPNSGRVFVFAGPLTGGLTAEDAVGWFEGGEFDGQPGGQLAIAPDLNGDGLDELVIGYYRHTVIFSGAPAPAARTASALSVLEMNTGGGAWHYATSLDEDGDGRSELVVGMDTYAGGAGLLGWVVSSDPSRLARTFSDPLWPGLGSKLTRVGDDLWSLSGRTPVHLGSLTGLAVEAEGLANGGDVDGNGVPDLLTELDGRVYAPELDLEGPLGGLQTNRDLRAPASLDGDASPDLPMLLTDGAAVLNGALGFAGRCDRDGDGVSEAAGDCDDDAVSTLPGAHDTCNGVDDDCSGSADAPAEVFLIAGAPNEAVELSASHGFARFGTEAVGLGTDSGRTITGLRRIGFANALDDSGAVWLLGDSADALLLLPAAGSGAADDLALARIANGAELERTGRVGTPGDIDGDGFNEVLSIGAAASGAFSLALFSAPLPEAATLDEATWLLHLPAGWTSVTLGTSPADIDADGRHDIVGASPSAWYGQGRLGVFGNLATGVLEADDVTLFSLYGQPGEALGTSLATGDLDGDLDGDALIGGNYGARILEGSACPLLTDTLPGATTWLTLVDLDGDGRVEPILGDGATLSREGLPWRSATAVLGVGEFGLLYTDEAGLWSARPGCGD